MAELLLRSGQLGEIPAAMSSPNAPRLGGSTSRRYASALLKFALVVLAVVAVNWGTNKLATVFEMDLALDDEAGLRRAVLSGAALYSLMLAMPFVPGVEVGLGMIALLGPRVVPLVYISTVFGLSLAFAVGRIASPKILIRFFDDLGLRRASDLLQRFEATDGELEFSSLAPMNSNRAISWLSRHRYLAVAIAINLPGNFVIGGGGGIALLAGLSRLYSAPAFILTVSLAVSPIPIAVMLLGSTVLN